MVEDRVTGGKRIAQLLASELAGLETGPLAGVAVVDADPDVTPVPDGAEAYAISSDGRRVGSVAVYPDRASLRLDAAVDPAELPDVSLPIEASEDGLLLWIESGAAVKRAVDVVRIALDASDGDA